MMKTANLTALVFTLSLSLAAIQPTSAMALGLTDLLEAGKGHLKDLGDRWNHDDQYVAGVVTGRGMFRDDDIGRDPAHWTDGTVRTMYSDGKTFIQFDDDFRNGLAPDLYVYVANSKVVDESTFWAAEAREVSKLQSGSGAQFYEVEGDFSEVIIWCKRFGAFMGAATVGLVLE